MTLLALLLASLYSLPESDPIPPPVARERARIEQALADLGAGERRTADRAARELALLGEVVLPLVVERLNQAEAGERLRLLAAVERMPRAAPLLEQARRDPHAAVRTWAAPPPPHPEPDLRLLAIRYLDLLAVAERTLRVKADEDQARFENPLGHPVETWEPLRAKLRDEELSALIQARRAKAAGEFALAGGLALRDGSLEPDLADPVFVAYVGLLREEDGWVLYNALTSLSALGPRLVPICEQLLERSNHDPRTILALLFAADRAGASDPYRRFGALRPDAQRALVRSAHERLDERDRERLLGAAALSSEETVRVAALDAFLALDPPAGREAAGQLLDPAVHGAAEFARAAQLLARAGDLELLEQYATLEIAPGGAVVQRKLRLLQGAARSALAETSGPEVEALGRRLLESPRKDLRTLGLQLVRDPDLLLEKAREEKDDSLAAAEGLRALELGGASAADATVGLFVERELGLYGLLQQLRAAGDIARILQLAQEGPADRRRAALGALGELTSIAAEHEAALLRLHDGALAAVERARTALRDGPERADETAEARLAETLQLRRAALYALLPLGSEQVRLRCEENPDLALEMLSRRSNTSNPIAFAFPLRRFLEGAGIDRLRMLAGIAESLPEVEPGLFFDLVQALDALPVGEREAESLAESGAAEQKVLLIQALARSRDRESAKRFLDLLASGEKRDPALAPSTCKAAAALLSPEELAALIPLLRREVPGEYPSDEGEPPRADLFRSRLLWAGTNALAWVQCEQALPFFCDVVLDPNLYADASDGKYASFLPWAVLKALRLFPAEKVEPAFREAIARAHQEGRLAEMHPGHLYTLVRQCREGRSEGRYLAEVAIALTEVLERLPYVEDVSYQRALALGTLNRYAEAAAAAREGAARKRARGYTERDGFWTPERMEMRALVYDAIASGDVESFRQTLPRLGGDPLLLYTAAWSLLMNLNETGLADEAAAASARGAGMLYHTYRDLLGAVRIAQNRPAEALDLLDPDGLLPVRRPKTSGWHLLWQAKAYLALGEAQKARFALENALYEDRRILPFARADAAFASLQEVFRRTDEAFFDSLFALE